MKCKWQNSTMANLGDLQSKSYVKRQISKKSEASVVVRQILRCALLGICIEAILIASALQTECTLFKNCDALCLRKALRMQTHIRRFGESTAPSAIV
jgi:hypothetical protein